MQCIIIIIIIITTVLLLLILMMFPHHKGGGGRGPRLKKSFCDDVDGAGAEEEDPCGDPNVHGMLLSTALVPFLLIVAVLLLRFGLGSRLRLSQLGGGDDVLAVVVVAANGLGKTGIAVLDCCGSRLV